MPRSAPRVLRLPYTIVIDTREQAPYLFDDIRGDSRSGYARLVVPTVRETLTVGDYSIMGYPNIIIERKSKQDLYQSIGQKRDNFQRRLAAMCEREAAFVVVESDWGDLLANPPMFTQFKPVCLSRTIQAWMIRYRNVHWVMVPGREFGERMTFRLLDRYWRDRQ